jgi:hypothetical protein
MGTWATLLCEKATKERQDREYLAYVKREKAKLERDKETLQKH